MATLIYLTLILLTSPVLSSPSNHEEYVERYENLVNNLAHDKTIVQQEERGAQIHDMHTQVTGSQFPCTVLSPSPTVPTSVHSLRPGDIKVVGAMGDSLTAGFGAGASNVLTLLTEYRGLSWSIGGDGTYEDQETLPNILKRYSPGLKGYSVGTKDDAEEGRFNVAVTGSIAADLQDQVKELISRMKNDPTVDFENDWKVITIMTGGNDICDVCFDQNHHNPSAYIQQITTTLDTLKAEVPRVFVNLVETINVEIAKEMNRGVICTVLHLACRCAAFPDGNEGEEIVVQTTEGYHTATEALVNSGRYDTSDDFTVVVQPFLKKTYLPRLPDNKPDMTFFAPDCFHLSRKGHATAANALWNNMIEREGQKSVVWSPGEPIKCPTEESPFFFTRKNSNISTEVTPVQNRELTVVEDDSFGQSDFDQADDSPSVAKNTPSVAKNTKPEANYKKVQPNHKENQVSTKPGPDDTDRQRAASNVVAIGTMFVALVGLGLFLAVLWTVQKRRNKLSYRVINEKHAH